MLQMRELLELSNWTMAKDKNFVQKYGVIVTKRLTADSSWDLAERTIQDLIQYIEVPLGNQVNTLRPFLKWIVVRYAEGGIRMAEDIRSRAIPAVQKFERLKTTGKLKAANKSPDLTTYKNLSALEDLIDDLTEGKELKGSDKQFEAELQANGEVEILYNDNMFSIVSPKTKRASCYYGRNTRWCTAGTGYNEFSRYTARGPLYIFLSKRENKRWQFHWNRSGGRGIWEVRNEKDKNAKKKMPKLLAKYPVLKQAFNHPKFYPIFQPKTKQDLHDVIRFNPGLAKKFRNLPEDLQLSLFDHGRRIAKNPKPALQRRILDDFEMGPEIIIKKLKGDTSRLEMHPKMQPNSPQILEALKDQPYLIRKIANPTLEQQMTVMETREGHIEFIKNPHPKVKAAWLQKHKKRILQLAWGALPSFTVNKKLITVLAHQVIREGHLWALPWLSHNEQRQYIPMIAKLKFSGKDDNYGFYETITLIFEISKQVKRKISNRRITRRYEEYGPRQKENPLKPYWGTLSAPVKAAFIKRLKQSRAKISPRRQKHIRNILGDNVLPPEPDIPPSGLVKRTIKSRPDDAGGA